MNGIELNSVAIKKIPQVLLRALLDFSGAMPIGMQPRATKELRSLALSFAQEDRESFDRAYDIVVNHRLPEAPDVSEIVAHKVSEILEAEAIKYKDRMLSILQSEANVIIAKTILEIKKEADREIRKVKNESVKLKLAINS